MRKGRGRTSRIRRRKLRSSESRGVNESYKPEFIELKKWLKDRKFEDTNLIPACFPATGRGLMSKTSLQEGQVIISLPESCLLTTDTVLRSYLGPYVAKLRCTAFHQIAWEAGLHPDLLLPGRKDQRGHGGFVIISQVKQMTYTRSFKTREPNWQQGGALQKGISGKQSLTGWQPPLSPLLALCTFLVAEKHAGDRSPWQPYLEILPKAYTCPVCLEPAVVNLLPRPLKAKAREQRTRVQELFAASRGFFSSLQPLFAEPVEQVFSYRAFLWAWCALNTRAVYMERARGRFLSAEPDTCVLAPYLDLLNHSPNVQVKGGFNEETRCYEISTGSRWRQHEEVLICYGPHDNQRLFLEYGFAAPHNPHAGAYVTQDMLVKYLPSTDKQMNKKISILKDHDFIENLTFGWDGPSWRLRTALKLLCLRPEEFPCWKKVLLGEIISDTNEKMSLDVAKKMCHYLREEADTVLRKVSRMKEREVALRTQLALVETLWTEELQVLRAAAETLGRP